MPMFKDAILQRYGEMDSFMDQLPDESCFR